MPVGAPAIGSVLLAVVGLDAARDPERLDLGDGQWAVPAWGCSLAGRWAWSGCDRRCRCSRRCASRCCRCCLRCRCCPLLLRRSWATAGRSAELTALAPPPEVAGAMVLTFLGVMLRKLRGPDLCCLGGDELRRDLGAVLDRRAGAAGGVATGLRRDRDRLSGLRQRERAGEASVDDLRGLPANRDLGGRRRHRSRDHDLVHADRCPADRGDDRQVYLGVFCWDPLAPQPAMHTTAAQAANGAKLWRARIYVLTAR